MPPGVQALWLALGLEITSSGRVIFPQALWKVEKQWLLLAEGREAGKWALCALFSRIRTPGPAFPASQMDNLTAVFQNLLAAWPKEVSAKGQVSVWKSPARRGRSHTVGLESVGNSSLSRGCCPPTAAPGRLRYQRGDPGQLVVGGSPFWRMSGAECVGRTGQADLRRSVDPLAEGVPLVPGSGRGLCTLGWVGGHPGFFEALYHLLPGALDAGLGV